jgi:Tfp pilus assembly pilus retraction ATPase PilT
MMSMDYSLAQLVRQARISNETAFSFCQDPETLQRYLISDAAMF